MFVVGRRPFADVAEMGGELACGWCGCARSGWLWLVEGGRGELWLGLLFLPCR